MTLAEVTQTNVNSVGLALIAIIVPALGWWSKTQADRRDADAKKLAVTAKERAVTIDSLEEELKRKDEALKTAEARLASAWKTLEEHAKARIDLIEQTSTKLEKEEERQRELRHELKAEIRSQSTRIYDLETENKALKESVAALMVRITALEKTATPQETIIVNGPDNPIPVAGTQDRKEAEAHKH